MGDCVRVQSNPKLAGCQGVGISLCVQVTFALGLEQGLKIPFAKQ
jgi:hypothetical protein